MSIISADFADTQVSETSFFWLEKDADINDMPENVHIGSLAVCIETGKKWVKNSQGEWAPFGG